MSFSAAATFCKMVTVLIWLPEGVNKYGHAALQTDKYYISLWPFRGKRFRCSEISITGCLHFHEKLDWILEGSSGNLRGPTIQHKIVNVTNEDINCVYEKFLIDNGIDPREVTLEAADRYTDRTKCRKKLPLTRYSLVGCVIVDKRIEKRKSDLLYFFQRCLAFDWGNIDICRDCIGKVMSYKLTRVNCPFYHKPQSCVTICFNLIEMADPRPDVCLVEARNTQKTPWSEDEICLQITVPNFEKHVQKYWIEGAGERDHYDADVFEEYYYRLLTQTFLNEMITTERAIFFMTWLLNALNYSFLTLFGLCWIILLIYFFFVLVKLYPSVRLPKFVVYLGRVGGVICRYAFSVLVVYYIKYSLTSTVIEASYVEFVDNKDIEDIEGMQKSFFLIAINLIQVCSYFFFVKISETVFRFIVGVF